jgi:hypothetical protein
VTDPTSAVDRLRYQVDHGAFSGASFDSSGAFQHTTTSPLNGSADGPHTVGFVATDVAGNVSDTVERSFKLDTAAPTITITKPKASLTTNANVTVEGQVADPLTGVKSLTA